MNKCANAQHNAFTSIRCASDVQQVVEQVVYSLQ